jgi:hypothetical protein
MRRYVRVAVSVLSLLAFIAFVVLWVRSYWIADAVSGMCGRWFIYIGTHTGQCVAEASVPISVSELIHAVGKQQLLGSDSPTTKCAVVFEDDGETGYFYALDKSPPGERIVDAHHVYNVDSVLDRYAPSVLRIAWSTDGREAALFVTGGCAAALDCVAQKGWCCSGFPPATGDWSKDGHGWDDRVSKFFDEAS